MTIDMKAISILTAILTVLIFCGTVFGAGEDAETRHAKAMTIIKQMVERHALHPIEKDFRTAHNRDAKADSGQRDEAAARTKVNCEDLIKLRRLIDVGRPLSDYSPIEKLGSFIGDGQQRLFVCGILKSLSDQGPEPHSIQIHIDANLITKVDRLVAAN